MQYTNAHHYLLMQKAMNSTVVSVKMSLDNANEMVKKSELHT